MMNNSFINILRALLFVFVQIVVLNNIQLFGVVTPYLYVLFLLTLPIKLPRGYVMLYAVAMGAAIDIFTNSYGFHFAAAALVAFLRLPVMQLFASRESMEKTQPSYQNFNTAFYKYVAVMVIVHHFCLFFTEAFSMKLIGIVLLKTLCSSAFTLVLIWCIELTKTLRKAKV